MAEPALSLVKERLESFANPAAQKISDSNLKVSALSCFCKVAGRTTRNTRRAWLATERRQTKVGPLRSLLAERELGVRINRAKGEYVVVEIDVFTKPIAAAFARAFREKLAARAA